MLLLDVSTIGHMLGCYVIFLPCFCFSCKHESCTLFLLLHGFAYLLLNLYYVMYVNSDLPQVKDGEEIQMCHKKGMEQQVSYLTKEFS